MGWSIEVRLPNSQSLKVSPNLVHFRLDLSKHVFGDLIYIEQGWWTTNRDHQSIDPPEIQSFFHYPLWSLLCPKKLTTDCEGLSDTTTIRAFDFFCNPFHISVRWNFSLVLKTSMMNLHSHICRRLLVQPQILDAHSIFLKVSASQLTRLMLLFPLLPCQSKRGNGTGSGTIGPGAIKTESRWEERFRNRKFQQNICISGTVLGPETGLLVKTKKLGTLIK